jgi:hypothetical protein
MAVIMTGVLMTAVDTTIVALAAALSALRTDIRGRLRRKLMFGSDHPSLVRARLAALDADELRELLIDAWCMVVPKKVAAAYLDGQGIR